MAQSFGRLGHVITTAYTTLGEEGLLKSLVEPDVEFVFCGEDQLDMVSNVIVKAEKVKWVVYEGTKQDNDVSSLSLVNLKDEDQADDVAVVAEDTCSGRRPRRKGLVIH